MKYCETCQHRCDTCKNYDPRSFLLPLLEMMDDFEFEHLCCPADFLVYSDIHEDICRLRMTINSLLSAYKEDVKN